MPIYEYRCAKCNTLFEEWTRHFDSQESETCPVCGGVAHRILSQTSFKLEGGGWFASCYGNKAAAPAATAETKPADTQSPAAAAAPVATETK